jgi:purine catabolism regulator
VGRVPVTLRSMLSMPALRDASPRVLAGADHLDRPVRWVHVLEVSDALTVLEGEEVVLTTGLPLTGSERDVREFVRQLALSRTCGLVVELGTRLAGVPDHVVDAAASEGVPLVTLDDTVRFVAVTESVHRLIVAEQYQGLEFAQRTHDVFTALSLESADAAAIVARTAELVGGPVVLEDLRHRVVAHAGAHPPHQHVLDRWEQRSRRAPGRDDAGHGGDEQWLVCPVGVRGATWGRLIAPTSVPGEGDDRDVMVLQRAAQALQISRLVEREGADLHLQAQQSLLQALSDGRTGDERDALTRAGALGMRPAPLYAPAVVPERDDGPADEISVGRRARSQVRSVGRALDVVAADGIVGSLGPDAVGLVLAVTSDAEADRALRRRSRALDEHQQPTHGTPVVGAGASAPSLLAASARLRSVLHVADAARALPTSLPYYRSTDVRLRGLLAQLQDDERLQAFAESELAAVLDLPEPERGASLDLLRAYVGHRGSKTATAGALGISRPAVYARLRRLEQRLSVGLDDWDSLLSLGVALLASENRPRPES